MRHAARWRDHGPSHHAAGSDAQIEADTIDMAVVALDRVGGIVGLERAAQFLMRADDETDARGGPAGERASFGVGRLLCVKLSGRQYNRCGRQKPGMKLGHNSLPRWII